MTDTKKLIQLLYSISDTIVENAQFLTDLDAAIGDSDHGINLARGFKKVETELPALEDKTIDAVLKKTGMVLVSTVGGASGPLYGTAFMKAGAVVKGKSEIDINDFLAIMDAAIGGVQLRGKAVEGEKTMLDAMIPANNAMKKAFDDGKDVHSVLQAGVEAADKGVEYTKSIIATKGRASYLGERSIGHQDPGATSFTILLKTIANAY
ncbi:MAG: dihydroxyacetone kinase subunit L [Erysipelotrichaceae bacterium]|jgi:dihydroxyacetone kinase-like protein|nr:dihydroxyacetone kinase subunit L [Erysipelotrichaceae bacterium]